MTPSDMNLHNRTMIHLKKNQQGLEWTLTSHDRHFIKQVTNMKAMGLNSRTEHKGLVLI